MGEWLVVACVCCLVWAIGLICLCHRRDIEIHEKVSWIVIVLVLHALGAIIYFLFGPSGEPEQGRDVGDGVSPDATPIDLRKGIRNCLRSDGEAGEAGDLKV